MIWQWDYLSSLFSACAHGADVSQRAISPRSSSHLRDVTAEIQHPLTVWKSNYRVQKYRPLYFIGTHFKTFLDVFDFEFCTLIHLGQLQMSDGQPWWRHQMETFSALLAICAGNSPVPGEFPTQRPMTRSFDVYFDLCPNKRLSKQARGLWFETQSRPLYIIVMWKLDGCLLAASHYQCPYGPAAHNVYVVRTFWMPNVCGMQANEINLVRWCVRAVHTFHFF